ncbi:MAG: hypothetical protein IH940_08855, partial [Acidobacteria bacterium]|nr:hypothetical protein [Acidobacteriota bacterium]
MSGYRLAVSTIGTDDPRVAQLRRAAHAMGVDASDLTIVDLYHLDGTLDQSEADLLAHKLLIDPVIQTGTWESQDDLHEHLEVGFRPGVADIAAEELLRAAHRLGVASLERCATGHRYLSDSVRGDALERLAQRLLVNEVTQRHTIGPLEPGFVIEHNEAQPTRNVPLEGLDRNELVALSAERGLSLSADEMSAIAEHFAGLGRAPTDAELEMLAQTWSEHCCHKTFAATITHGDESIPGLLNEFLRAPTDKIDAPWV